MLHGTGRALLGARKKYYQKVKGTNPIAYWPMWEPSGSVSQDLILAAQNGAYTGVTLAQPGIGDGRASPFFDGANDFNNIYSATLAGRFNGAEGTVMAWARVANAGVWTDGQIHRPLIILTNTGSYVIFDKVAANNTLQAVYKAGLASKVFTENPVSSVDWFQLALTWSKSIGASGETRVFLNGAQAGATQTNLGDWAGALSATRTLVGSSTQAPVWVWHGNLAHIAVWDRALTPTQVASLAVV